MAFKSKLIRIILFIFLLLNFFNTSLWSQSSKKLLIISSQISIEDEILAAVKEDVIIIKYNYDQTHLEALLKSIQEAINGEKIRAIG